MAITLLNLRTNIPGQAPASLQAGQICFNLADKLMYVGDGADSNSNFNGETTPGVPGSGWFSMPLDAAGFSESFLISPNAYGDIPADGDTLQWNSALDHLEWVPGGGSAQPAVEGLVFGLTTNNVSGYNVSLGFGANGTLTTGTGNVAIGGASGDVTSGSYNVAIGFDTSVADPTGDKQLAIGPDAYARWLTGDSSMNVKLGAGLVDATNSTGTAGQILSSTGTALQWINNTADGVLGVTGTTPVNVDNTDPQNPVISVDAGTTTIIGVVQLEDSTSSTSTTTAATPNSVKTVYDLADAALPRTGGTMTGDIVFANGQPVDAGFF